MHAGAGSLRKRALIKVQQHECDSKGALRMLCRSLKAALQRVLCMPLHSGFSVARDAVTQVLQ